VNVEKKRIARTRFGQAGKEPESFMLTGNRPGFQDSGSKDFPCLTGLLWRKKRTTI